MMHRAGERNINVNKNILENAASNKKIFLTEQP